MPLNIHNRRIITICNQFAGNIERDIPPFCQNGRCITSGGCRCTIQNIHLYGFPGHNNGSFVPAIEHGIFVNHKATVISSIGKRADTGNSILRLFTEINFCSVYNGIPRATLTTVPFINHPLRSALRPDTILKVVLHIIIVVIEVVMVISTTTAASAADSKGDSCSSTSAAAKPPP
ncbi:hypothetical protein FQ011_22595 [Escherichia coli]|uniref:hypothetical protein n=1 Tax=Escherichia coli TaxID=562 RepID=UPI001326BEB2|nr:hypothetical protein [Escherichia coli]MXD46569.1 hypothetical protein [Escherichia coli]